MTQTIREQLQALVDDWSERVRTAEEDDRYCLFTRTNLQQLEAILSASPPAVSVKPGWVCKSAIGVQWTDTKPEWFESYGWSCFDEALIVDECITDPWPDKPNGGPECCMEVK